MSESVDLARYFARIEYSGEATTRLAKPDLATLSAIHFAHATHIPFENLDVLLKRPIRLDSPSLQAKLIDARRGGYCFEQNALLATALETIGFPVKRLAARVLIGTDPRPRTHMMLIVTAEGEPWLADVGFGGGGLLHPIRFRVDDVADCFGWKYRIGAAGAHYLLQTQQLGEWQDLYTFTLEDQLPVDYEMANYYTSTHPQSHFTRVLTAQLPGPDRRLRLTNRRFSVEAPTGITEEREIGSDEELLEILSEKFGLNFPKGTTFPVPES